MCKWKLRIVQLECIRLTRIQWCRLEPEASGLTDDDLGIYSPHDLTFTWRNDKFGVNVAFGYGL